MKRGGYIERKTPLRRSKIEVKHGSQFTKAAVAGNGTTAKSLVASQGQRAPAPIAFPKPTRSGKSASAPLRRSRIKRKAGGTKHSRRPREWGFMSFARDRGCELNMDRDTQRLFFNGHICEGPREFAHLGDRRRYETGDVGAGLCRAAHRGFDGKIGGKSPWYAVLERSTQSMVRMRLANRARRAWDMLEPEEREVWERKAEAWRASLRRAA